MRYRKLSTLSHHKHEHEHALPVLDPSHPKGAPKYMMCHPQGTRREMQRAHGVCDAACRAVAGRTTSGRPSHGRRTRPGRCDETRYMSRGPRQAARRVYLTLIMHVIWPLFLDGHEKHLVLPHSTYLRTVSTLPVRVHAALLQPSRTM